MKFKNALPVAVVVMSISLGAFAEKQVAEGKVYLLKSGGETIAELRTRTNARVALEADRINSRAEYDVNSGTMIAKGGATLKLFVGTNSISVRAEEIECVPDSK